MKKNSSYHIHKIKNDSSLIAEKRRDSITHELIRQEDEVVLCQVCKSVFLVDSWEYIHRKHCGQHKTLKRIPKSKKLSIDRKRIQRRYRVRKVKSYYPVLMFLMAFVGVIGMIGFGVNILQSESSTLRIRKISITEEHYLMRGDYMYKHQNYIEAKQYYKAALGLNSQNKAAQKRLEQLENEYLLHLEEGDRLFRDRRYVEAEYWYMKALFYKNASYPKSRLEAISVARAEAPIIFEEKSDISEKDVIEMVSHRHIQKWNELPEEIKEIAKKANNLPPTSFAINKEETEILLSYASGRVELRTLVDLSEKKKAGHLLKVLKGTKNTQAVFVDTYVENAQTQIALIGSKNRIYYYFLQPNKEIDNFMTFHFDENEKAILSQDGQWFVLQSEGKLLKLYSLLKRAPVKILRTHEHRSFIGDAYFDETGEHVVAQTALGTSKWALR